MTLKFIVIFVLVLLSSVLMIAWRIFAPIDAVQENEPLIVDISENRSPIKNNTPAVFQEKLPILAEVPTAQIIVPATVSLPKAESVSQIIAPSKEIDLVNLKFPTLSIENINKYSVPSYSNILNANNEVLPSPEDNAVNEKTKLINAPLFPIFLEAESKKTDGFLTAPFLMEDPKVVNASHNHQITLGTDGEIILVQGCSSCGKGTIGSGGGMGAGGSHLSGGPVACGPEGCTPGRHNCYPWEHNKTFAGRMAGAMYEALCCPDPCYEGKWIPLADSAFYSDSIRPISQQKLRLDIGRNLVNPTRNAYMFAPNPIFPYPVNSLNYNDVYLSTEIATGGFSILSDISYRTLSINPSEGGGAFGDMMIGTKSLLFDTELIQIAMEFKTFLPTGNFTSGYGTGHVSLEPSLLACLKLKEKTYLQGQISEWIPLGSTTPPVGTAGSLLHAHLSLNHVLHEVNPDIPIIGTLEYTGYYFQAGGNQDVSSIPTGGSTTSSSATPTTNNFYGSSSSGSSSSSSGSAPALPFSNSSGVSYQYIGPGLRMFMGSHYDMGVGAQFALSGDNRFAEQLYRVEFRLRY
ncbi:MAG: hypothetical protein WCJ06_18410 [Planctomycetota bacterium]